MPLEGEVSTAKRNETNPLDAIRCVAVIDFALSHGGVFGVIEPKSRFDQECGYIMRMWEMAQGNKL